MTNPGSGSPNHGANQDDAIWLDLVARLEGGAPEASKAEAGTAEVRDEHHDPTEPPGQDRTTSAAGRPPVFRDFDPLGLAGAAPEGPRDYGVTEDDDVFIPEEPPSLAGTDPLTMLAWLGAVGAPVALLLSTMFWRSAPLLAIWGMVAVFVLAVAFLLMKLPQDKDENDDGARV